MQGNTRVTYPNANPNANVSVNEKEFKFCACITFAFASHARKPLCVNKLYPVPLIKFQGFDIISH